MCDTSSLPDQTTTNTAGKWILAFQLSNESGTQTLMYSDRTALENAVSAAKEKPNVVSIEIYTLESSMKKVSIWQ